MQIFNSEIDFKSFFKRGIKKVNEPFGVFLITGYMGSGKTYFSVYFATSHIKNYTIKTNIHSLNIPNAKIEYFNEIKDIIDDDNEFYLYIIDELGKKYTKENKADKDFYNFLQHSRKCKRIVLIIHQEYLQVPQWLRGVAREVFTTNKIRFLPLFITYKGNAVLDPLTLEWGVDYNKKYIYKRNKYIANYYNTFETIKTL